MTTLYANIRYDPKHKSRWIRSFERRPRLQTGAPVWYEESWSASRMMGESHAEPRQTTQTGAGWNGQANYDARVVSDQDATEIAAIDGQIADLQKRKQQLVEERFRTWERVKPTDCARTIPGRSLQSVKAELRKAKPASAAEVKEERNLVGSLNKAIGILPASAPMPRGQVRVD